MALSMVLSIILAVGAAVGVGVSFKGAAGLNGSDTQATSKGINPVQHSE